MKKFLINILYRYLIIGFGFFVLILLGGVISNWDDLMSFIDNLPLIKIFFLVATILMVIFAVPLWKKLNS